MKQEISLKHKERKKKPRDYHLSHDSRSSLALPDVRKKAPWFDDDCRATKASFLNAKRVFRDNAFSTARKESFLEARKQYALAKRKARRKFEQSERLKYANMGKKITQTILENNKQFT